MPFSMQMHCILNKQKGGVFGRSETPLFSLSASAAAAGKEDDGDDYEPDPLVIEKVAKTVVHIMSSVIV